MQSCALVRSRARAELFNRGSFVKKIDVKEQLYELRRELKKEKIRSHGLGGNPLANMSLAQAAIVQHDIESREATGDKSRDCLGILRKNDHLNGITMWLWGIQSLVIMSEFSRAGRLVAYLDSTKMGHLGLHGTETGRKLLFTKFFVQPGDAFVKGSDDHLLNKQYFKGIKMAECVTDKNKTSPIQDFIQALADSCLRCTGVELKFQFIHTDMASQLKNAILGALGSKEKHVSTQIMYSNIFFYIYLRLAAKMVNKKEANGGWVEAASWAWNKHQEYSPCGIHDCGSHVYRSFVTWLDSKDRQEDAPEVKSYCKQFGSMIKSFASETKDMDDISMATARISLLIAIVSTEILPCPNFTVNSRMKEKSMMRRR